MQQSDGLARQKSVVHEEGFFDWQLRVALLQFSGAITLNAVRKDEILGASGCAHRVGLKKAQARDSAVQASRLEEAARDGVPPKLLEIGSSAVHACNPATLGAPSAAGDGFAGFLVGGAAALGFTLVPKLLALGEGEFKLHFTVFEVHPGGDQGEAFLLGFADEPAKFLAVDKQFASAKRSMIKDVAVLVGPDVCIQKPEFAVLEQAVGVLEIGAAGADGFDLGSGEDHPGFKFFQQEVVVGSDPIDGGVSLPGGGRIPARIFFRTGLGLMCGRARHRYRKTVTQKGRR